MFDVGISYMSKSEEGRTAAVERLKMLWLKSETIVVYMTQDANESGKPAGKPRFSDTKDRWGWQFRFEEYYSEETTALWRETCNLLPDGRFDSDDVDGGMLAWLFDHSQQFWKKNRIDATLVDPIAIWLEELRSFGRSRKQLHETIVAENPQTANRSDIEAVAAKARFVASSFHNEFNKCESVKKDKDRDAAESLRANGWVFAPVALANAKRELVGHERELFQQKCYADVVRHYAVELLPLESLKAFPQICRGEWTELNRVNWVPLEDELNHIALTFERLRSPVKVESPAIDVANELRRRRLVLSAALGIAQKSLKKVCASYFDDKDWQRFYGDADQASSEFLRLMADELDNRDAIDWNDFRIANANCLLTVSYRGHQPSTAHEAIWMVGQVLGTAIDNCKDVNDRSFDEECRLEAVTYLRDWLEALPFARSFSDALAAESARWQRWIIEAPLKGMSVTPVSSEETAVKGEPPKPVGQVKSKSNRGRPTGSPKYDEKMDEAVANDWATAKSNGTSMKDFAKFKNHSLKAIKRTLDRVYGRRRKSSN